MTLFKAIEQYQSQYQTQGIMVSTDRQPDLKPWIIAPKTCWSSPFFSNSPIIQPTVSQLTKKNAVGDGVQNFMQFKIYRVHDSPLMHRTGRITRKGDQLGQA